MGGAGQTRPGSPQNEMLRAALGRQVGSRVVGIGVAVTGKRWWVQGLGSLYGEVSIHSADGVDYGSHKGSMVLAL